LTSPMSPEETKCVVLARVQEWADGAPGHWYFDVPEMHRAFQQTGANTRPEPEAGLDHG
jgi:hypothetical protein